MKASALARASAEDLLYQLGVSALVLPPLSLAMGEPGVFAPTPMVWGQVLPGGDRRRRVVSGLVLAGARVSGHAPVLVLLPDPVMGVLAGGLILGEPLTPAVFAAPSRRQRDLGGEPVVA